MTINDMKTMSTSESADLKKRLEIERRRASLWNLAWSRFKKQKLSIFGAVIALCVIILAIFAPILSPYDPKEMHWGEEMVPPCRRFLLGTDELGRDVLSQIIWGARTSLVVGLGAVGILVLIGVIIGSISGYFGGWVDELLMRITDIMLTIPTLFLIILMASIFKSRGIGIIILIIGVTGWPQLARITRSMFLSIKELPYVDAARAMGASNLRIIYRHIFPNAIAPIIVSATFRLASAVLTEAALSFLGLSDPTIVSWGKMLSVGHTTMRYAWWIATFPGIAIFLTVIGFNLLGDGLRDALEAPSGR